MTWAFFIFLIAYVLVLGVIFVYVAANIGLVVYFWTKARERVQLDPALHLPGGHEPRLIYSIYAAFVPLPAAPNNWTPLVAAAWLGSASPSSSA